MSIADFAVRASVGDLQNVVQGAFLANGLKPRWDSATKGRGIGEFYSIDFEIFPAVEGTTLRLRKAGSGIVFGGAGLGIAYVRFKQVKEWVSAQFQSRGVLVGVNER